jgi:hypothetical protein
MENVLGSVHVRVYIRSQLSNFSSHQDFVSCVEPKKVYEALEDPDWLIAMHEELNNFERNKVWTLVRVLRIVLSKTKQNLALEPRSSLQGGGNGSHTSLIKLAEEFVDEEVDVVTS